MAPQIVAEVDSTVSSRSKVVYDRSPMKPIKANRSPDNQNRRKSAGNIRRSDDRQQNRRRSDRPQHQNRPAFHQRRSSGQQRPNNHQIQRRSISPVAVARKSPQPRRRSPRRPLQ